MVLLKMTHSPKESLTKSSDIHVYVNPKDSRQYLPLSHDMITLWARTMIENPEVTEYNPPLSPPFQNLSTQAIKSPNRLTEVPDRSTPGTLLDFANTPATNLNLGQVLAMTNLNNALASQLNPLAAQLNPLAMQLNPLAAQLNPLAAQMAQVPSASNTNASTGTADLPSSPAPSDSNVVVSQSVSQATQSSVQSH
ncbi:hypothetical protein MJO28_008977 [Puccinia striiformis f. sp. tritici]|uniref:Uncharacterized protein n=1 Tax=Puccinia striiformis f. sp. tritici TaxID=168172 RepID=A0ACC0EDR5_9BASI|nr:hypothetical protein MJO28_008977 [Puccinia striiformis f. sp. tritici]KAI7953205.1 hypothetical protein MJO29_008836 [Puccinia striiformis f. sp. tritici]